jgi:hypothetical protein
MHSFEQRWRAGASALPPGFTRRGVSRMLRTCRLVELVRESAHGYVTGTRNTFTYPVGSRIGNDQPVTTTSEDWVSPRLRINVYSQNTSYDGAVSTTTLKDFSIAEPDPSFCRSLPDTGSSTKAVLSP